MVACAGACWLLLSALAKPLGVQGRGVPPVAPPLNASVPALSPSLWFDYPDDDAAFVRAAYERLGEPPRATVPNPLPRLLRRVTLGASVLVLLLLLAQVVAPLYVPQARRAGPLTPLSRRLPWRTHEAEPALRSSQGSLIGAAAPAPPLLGGAGGRGAPPLPLLIATVGGTAPAGVPGSEEAPPPPARAPAP